MKPETPIPIVKDPRTYHPSIVLANGPFTCGNNVFGTKNICYLGWIPRDYRVLSLYNMLMRICHMRENIIETTYNILSIDQY